MLREFIKCNGLADRINLIDNSVPEDWTESELATVCQIVGITDRVKGMDMEETLEVIRAELSEKLNESLDDDTTLKAIRRLSDEEDPVKEESVMNEALAAQIHMGKTF